MKLSKENIREGDIIVMGLAYYGGISDAGTLLSTIENHPYCRRHLC